MPSSLALLLCLAFVAALLWVDRQRSLRQPISGWLPTIWLLYCASRPVNDWFAYGQFEDGDGTVEGGSAVERAFLIPLITLGLITLGRRKIDWFQIRKENKWLFLLFAYMLVSILWSDFQFVSFKRWVKTAGTVIMALVVLTELDPYETLQSVLRRLSYILIPFSALLVKYYPRLGVTFGRWSGGTMWVGVTQTKNTLGVLCMVSIFFIVWTLVRRAEGKESFRARHQTRADLAVLALAVWLMRGPGGAYSATSTAVLLLGLGVFFTLRRSSLEAKRLGPLAFGAVAGGGLILAIMIAVFDFSPMSLAASSMGRDSTLTGRTDLIWSVLIPLSAKNPILGIGYGAFWIKPVFEFSINEAHNGYLDVFIELGAVGLFLLPILAIAYFKKAQEEFDVDRDWASLKIAFLLIIFVHNITETSFLRSTATLWNLFVLLIVVSPRGLSRRHEFSLTLPESDFSGKHDSSQLKDVTSPTF